MYSVRLFTVFKHYPPLLKPFKPRILRAARLDQRVHPKMVSLNGD